jgi:hypothetical protein
MTDLDVAYFDAYRRTRDFGLANASFFPKNSRADVNFKIIADGIPVIEASGALQASNIGTATTVSKESIIASIWLRLRKINRTARGLAVDQPEIGELFRMPHGDNHQVLAAKAMAFYTNSEQYEELMKDCGMSDTFRADLLSDIEALQAAISDQNEVKSTKVGATGNIKAQLKLMHDAWKRLLGIVPNIFEDDPAKLAEWASASHVKRPPKTKKTPETPKP